MGVNITGIFSDLQNLVPSQSDILNQVLAGAAGTVVLSGLKSNAGQDAVDPLHLFHKDGSSTVIGPTIPASVFSALPAAQQQALMAQKYVVVAG